MTGIYPNHSDALLIFAKWPQTGRVKTRLSPPLSLDEATALYRCMLQDTIDATRNLPGVKRMLFFAAEGDRTADFRGVAPDAAIFRQQGDDLGERLVNAFGTAFGAGCRSALAIGTDSPHMPSERISTALSLLHEEGADAVFGPSEDGGYYLVGMKKMQRELFRDIPWSSRGVLEASLSRAASLGLRVSLLPAGFDLDTVDDLKRLAAREDDGLAALTRGYVKQLGY